MSDTAATTLIGADADIKQIPPAPELRRAIRVAASEMAAGIDAFRPLCQAELERCGWAVLNRLALPSSYLGFAMMAVNNGAWQDAFAAVPLNRRLLLLPHCLSSHSACRGTYGAEGLHCAGCGSCSIDDLQARAGDLGYQVIIAEGTSPVLARIMEGRADALLGVACMDSLARSFSRTVELGIPQLAVPLLRDGCVDTVAEMDYLQTLLHLRNGSAPKPHRSFLPLLRRTGRLFQEPEFSQLLVPAVQTESLKPDRADAMHFAEREAIEWLRDGGKRLRPFLTIASFVVARHGLAAIQRMDDDDHLLPEPVRWLSLAIESLHKASLVHDDIEDDDDFRYGRQALHIRHGLGPAINIGDYLIGLGYRLAATAGQALDDACAGDVVTRLTQAHQELCRGQAAELLWLKKPDQPQTPIDVLTAYALKTSPAFEAAIYCGLRAAGAAVAEDPLRRICAALGQAFQIANDLDDWIADERNKMARAKDALCNRPTILRAFAVEAGFAKDLAALHAAVRQARSDDLPGHVERLRRLYSQSSAFVRAEQLMLKLRDRAHQAACDFPFPDLRELMQFLVGLIVPIRTWSELHT